MPAQLNFAKRSPPPIYRCWCKSNELSYSDQYISFWDVSIYIWKRSKNILPRTFDALCCHIISTFDVPTLVQLHSNPGEPPPPEILWHISPLTWPTCQWSFLQNSQPQLSSTIFLVWLVVSPTKYMIDHRMWSSTYMVVFSLGQWIRQVSDSDPS